jgi:hypothetical protein
MLRRNCPTGRKKNLSNEKHWEPEVFKAPEKNVVLGGKPSEYEIPMKNEILEEIWCTREEIEQEYGGDLRKVFNAMKKKTAALKKRAPLKLPVSKKRVSNIHTGLK